MKKYMMRKASTDIINWLNCIWLTDLPSNSKYLACYLRKFMNSNNDIAWPSYARIVAETGLAKSTVAKYLKILEKEGWIQRHSGNSNTNTVYIASLPKHIGETVKKFDDEVQKQIKGSTRDGLRSSTDGLHVVRETDTNIQSNTQENKQPKPKRFSGEQKERRVFSDELSRVDFKNTKIAMQVMREFDRELKDSPDGSNIYTGSLRS